jgi:hypothetical protein
MLSTEEKQESVFLIKFCPSWPAAAFFVTGYHAAAEGSLSALLTPRSKNLLKNSDQNSIYNFSN